MKYGTMLCFMMIALLVGLGFKSQYFFGTN